MAFRIPNFLRGLSIEQKVASGLLLVLGGCAVVMGLLSFGSNLSRPFEIELATAPPDTLDLNGTQASAAVEASKHTDTDGDGLSDYDETNVYKTSPYLKDTDSDGIDDFTEVTEGTDPNCPKGQTCSDNIASADTSDTTTPSATATPPTQASNLAPPAATPDQFGLTDVAAAGGFASVDQVVAYLKALTPDQQVALLKQAGLTDDKLKGLTSAQITQLFDQTVDAAASSGQLDSLVTAGSSSSDQTSGSSTGQTDGTPTTSPTTTP